LARQESESQRSAQTLSRWQDRPADERALIESFDTHANLRNVLRNIADKRGDWAGIPMPLDGERLIIEPTYPDAEALMKMGRVERDQEHEEDDGETVGEIRVRNSFYSWRTHCDISIVEITQQDGTRKIDWTRHPAIHSLEKQLQTLGCMEAWGIEQESNAIHLLAQHVSHRQMKQYLLTGSFLETSERSNVTYMFRKLRPTVAMHAVKGQMRIMCALCLHPIAYYANSFAGAMAPTDDVCAHLLLMRGDEKLFWRRANQHAAYRPEAAL
jgi:hypothetical protein